MQSNLENTSECASAELHSHFANRKTTFILHLCTSSVILLTESTGLESQRVGEKPIRTQQL